MRKLKPDPISKEELSEYLDNQDDFALELRTLAVLKGNGYDASHGGSYTDPITGANRQYDIRASIKLGNCEVQLAVECKCLQPNFPLLVSCVQRTKQETYHELMISWRNMQSLIYFQKVIRLRNHQTIYRPGEYVGKSTTQVGKTPSGDEYVTGDSEVFDKWSQAIASANDLIKNAQSESDGFRFTAIIPVLVVPDGTMWQVLYDENGNQQGEPTPATESYIYIGKTYRYEKRDFTISHINVYTFSKLQIYANQLKYANPYTDLLFPSTELDKAVGIFKT